MSLPPPTFAPFGDHRVAYYSYGSGTEALVFIHGYTCDSSLWEPQAPLFEKFGRTVLVDYIGHGNSDAPDIVYSMETIARSVKAALHHAKVDRAVIVCHSMGGVVTTNFLRFYPKMVKGIIYVDSFFRLPEHYLSNLELESTRERFGSDEKFEQWIRAILGGSPDDEKVVKRMMSTPKNVRISATGTECRPHAFRYDEVYDVPAVHIGTMFAKMDPFWKHHVPQIELHEGEWHDCAHFPFLDQPERFNAAVEELIREKKLL